MPIPSLKPRMYEPRLPPKNGPLPLPIRVLRGCFRLVFHILWFPFRLLHRVLFRPSRSFSSLLGGALMALMLAIGVGGLALVGTLAYFARTLPDPEHLAFRNITESTKIYDRTGTKLLYDIHGDVRRTVIPLAEVPRDAINAAIAVEDKNFYLHEGVVFRSIARAAFFNIFGNTIGKLVLRRSEGAGGASTLTQQLAKNAILTNERTLARKLKEAFVAYRIEKKFSKDEILSLYFNEIPYGSVTYGIEAAAQTFFHKHARELDLAESALLAAVPRAPTRLSPYGNHTEELIARWRHIINLMVEQGMVSAATADAAKSVDILARVKPKREAIIAPHFVLYVKDLLTEQYGEDVVERGGLAVITALDYDLQKIAETAVADGMPLVEKNGGSNASLAAVDPRTGDILAMVGSRDYFDDEHDGQVNVALRPRQPGSSIKPIVYAAAFSRGLTPTTILYDVVTTFKTDTAPYTPHNYDLVEHGPVTARAALAGSLNIPAVKMLYLAGVGRVLDLADALGYTTLSDRSRFGLSLVLGGAEVKLLEHVSAFGTFASDGVRRPPTAILKIKDAHGGLLFERQQEEERRVIDPEVARSVTDVLQDNNARAFIFGAANRLTLPGRPVAAKTGTTNDFHDAWTVGFTPSLAAGVWVGNNDNRAMSRGADGSKIAAPIWNQFMREAHKEKPVESFTPPTIVVTGKAILDGQSASEVTVRVDRISGKLATAYTPSDLVESRTYSVDGIHSELYYISKDDPRGPPPENPAADPQFASWEEAVGRWITENGVSGAPAAALPPTDYDDIHVPENIPTITILAPAEGGTLSSRDATIDVAASAPRFPILKIEVRLDGHLIGSAAGSPSSIVVSIPPTFARGFHSLEARIYDSVQNSGTATININLMAD